MDKGEQRPHKAIRSPRRPPQCHHNPVALPGVPWRLTAVGDLQKPLRYAPPRPMAVNRRIRDGSENHVAIRKIHQHSQGIGERSSSFVSQHPRSSSYSRPDRDRLTKILTKTARLPTAIDDARASGGRGRFSLRGGLLRFPAVDGGGRSRTLDQLVLVRIQVRQLPAP